MYNQKSKEQKIKNLSQPNINIFFKLKRRIIMNETMNNGAVIESTVKEATIIDKIKCPYVWMGTMAVAFAESPMNVFAEDANNGEVNFNKAATPVVSLINQILGPLITVVAALAAVYCVFLGVKLAKADEPQEREKAKMALKNAIIGFFLIFILIVVLRILTPQLANWVDVSTAATGAEKIGK